MPRRRHAPWVARLLLLTALTVATAMLVDAALAPVAHWGGFKNPIPDRITPNFLLLALLFAPIGEELLFRAGLRRADYTLAIGPLLLIAALAPWVRATFIALAVWALAALLVNRWLEWRVLLRPGARVALARRFIANYAGVFWGYTLVFALAHASNYGWSGPRSAVAPLLVLPQFLIGAVLGYLRLRDGLRSSMLMHFMVNAVALAAAALSAAPQ